MAAEDSAFVVDIDRESGLTVLHGLSETYLNAKLDVLNLGCKGKFLTGGPQVAYREGLGQSADIDFSYKKQDGQAGEFARVRIVFEPGVPNSGFVFRDQAGKGAIPRRFVPAIMAGVEAAKENGLLAGFPVIDFSATLTDGAYHDLDSSRIAFEHAARRAFSQLREQGAPKLMEPIMRVEVVTPSDFIGAVIADFNSRRGHIVSCEGRGEDHVVSANAPLSSLFGYEADLHQTSDSRATCIMVFDQYADVPSYIDPDPEFPPAIAMRV
ncbi:hypothetical protein BH11PSE2_BH11PSE2_05870 [soil metagenome]